MTALIASHITTSPPAVVSVNVFPKSREKSFCATCFGNDPALSMISVSQEGVYLSIYKTTTQASQGVNLSKESPTVLRKKKEMQSCETELCSVKRLYKLPKLKKVIRAIAERFFW